MNKNAVILCLAVTLCMAISLCWYLFSSRIRYDEAWWFECEVIRCKAGDDDCDVKVYYNGQGAIILAYKSVDGLNDYYAITGSVKNPEFKSVASQYLRIREFMGRTIAGGLPLSLHAPEREPIGIDLKFVNEVTPSGTNVVRHGSLMDGGKTRMEVEYRTVELPE